MTDTYITQARPLNNEPYRGPERIHRATGRRQVWNGQRYVDDNNRSRLTPEEQRSISEAEAIARRYQGHLPALQRFEELNRTVPTGAWFQRFGQSMPLGPAPRLFSWDANGDRPGGSSAEFDEMRSINSTLAPEQREPGSGSSSNIDVQMFREGLPNVDRPGPANQNIINRFRERARDAQDYADFVNWYWPQTGTLNNADAEFNRFRAARERNPRLTWRQFFRASEQRGGPTRQQQGTGSNRRLRYNPETGDLE